jgi:hypothetical protein
MGAGPHIPLEFARISLKRKRALTLVIEPESGEGCVTHAIDSVRDDIHEAADDLALRTGFIRSSSARIAQRVTAWCLWSGASGAVWTDLPRNFHETTGEPFSLDAAVEYLKALRPKALEEAHRYIENAPEHTDTPLRRHLAGDPWWRSLGPVKAK